MQNLTPDESRAVAEYLSGQSNNFANFSQNTSPLNYNADMARNYDASMGGLNYSGSGDAALDLAKQVSKNMSKFRFRVSYTKAAGPGAANPVFVQFFQTVFNNGTFTTAGDMQFTNTGGDIVTISRMSPNAPTVQQFYSLLVAKSLGIAWARITARDFAQLQNPMTIQTRSQFTSGSFNEIVPDDYYRPDYYDKLTVEMAMGFIGAQEEGFDWTINSTETSPGTIIVFNVGSAIDMTKLHSGQAPVRKLGPELPFFQVNTPIGTPMVTAVNNHIALQNGLRKMGMSTPANPQLQMPGRGQ